MAIHVPEADLITSATKDPVKRAGLIIPMSFMMAFPHKNHLAFLKKIPESLNGLNCLEKSVIIAAILFLGLLHCTEQSLAALKYRNLVPFFIYCILAAFGEFITGSMAIALHGAPRLVENYKSIKTSIANFKLRFCGNNTEARQPINYETIDGGYASLRSTPEDDTTLAIS